MKHGGITTHVLDTHAGRPAVDVQLELAVLNGEQWEVIAQGVTDEDGRAKSLLGVRALAEATYRLRFNTARYYRAQGVAGLYPYVEIVFHVDDAARNFHIPLLLTANGYSTYRGS